MVEQVFYTHHVGGSIPSVGTKLAGRSVILEVAGSLPAIPCDHIICGHGVKGSVLGCQSRGESSNLSVRANLGFQMEEDLKWAYGRLRFWMSLNQSHQQVRDNVKHWQEEIVAMEVAMESETLMRKLENAHTPEAMIAVFNES